MDEGRTGKKNVSVTANRRSFLRWAALLAAGSVGVLALVALLWLSGPNGPEPGTVAGGDHGPAALGRPQQVSTPNPRADPEDGGDPLWVAVDESSVANPPPYAAEWSEEGRALVRVSRPRHWQVGDRLTLPLPQLGETYRPLIEEIDEGLGARALLGKIAGDDGQRRRYVVTVGPTSLFAFIDTPNGTYELAADTEYGWLLPSSSMMAGWDFSKPDYFLEDPQELRDTD